MLFPTMLVGSYPQPEWLIDRKRLAGRFPPRVRARELWRIPPEYLEEVLAPEEPEEAALDGVPAGEKDPLYDQAVEIVLRTRRPSISLVQRHLRIGYNRAARLIEDMERAGMVTPMQSNGNREVLVPAKAE